MFLGNRVAGEMYSLSRGDVLQLLCGTIALEDSCPIRQSALCRKQKGRKEKRERKGGWGEGGGWGGGGNMGADLKLRELLSHIPDIYSTEGHSEEEERIFREII